MRKLIFLFVIIVGIFVIASSGLAFRCGINLVTKGDRKTKVIMTCGEPTSKKEKCGLHHPETGICVDVWEVWTYNCGETDFFYELIFDENDILISDNSIGRGIGKSQCKGNSTQ